MTSVPYPIGYRSSVKDADAALAEIQCIYAANTAYLRDRFAAFAAGTLPPARVSAGYPRISLEVEYQPRLDTRLSFGFVPGPGRYSTTLSRPDLFQDYYREQLALLLINHDRPLHIEVSELPIPIHFAFPGVPHVEGELQATHLERLAEFFDLPDLSVMDDQVVNGTLHIPPGADMPLALFNAPRVDFSLQRLRHYTATSATHFQNYVLFTNYQFYVDEFIRFGQGLMHGTEGQQGDYSAFVEPGDVITYHDGASQGEAPPRLPQMPAYHLKRPDGSGITLINIGVGPSNAKTITDHVAVLRPHAWLMLGHCAGLRNSQKLGDYVLAHGYVREDHVLDQDLPLWVPLPPLAEMQQALEQAVSQVTGLAGYELKRVMRTGTVATIDDRNWELRDYREPVQRFSQSRAIALDMESATVSR